MAEDITDFENRCRICFISINGNHPVSLMDTIKVNELSVIISAALQEVYPFFLKITKRDDCLPKNICFDCLNNLKISYKFRKTCEINNQKILEILNEHNNLKNRTIQKYEHYKYNIEKCLYFKDLLSRNEQMEKVSEIDNIVHIGNKETDFKEDTLTIKEKSVDTEYDETEIKCNEIAQKEECQSAHEASLLDIKYKCPSCTKTFRSLSGFSYHKKTHENNWPLACDLCSKKFPTERRLILHMYRHDSNFAHLCPECGKRFLTSTELVRHRRTHANIKLFKCNICLKKFSQCYNLKLHKMRHIGYRPNVCEICNKRFTTVGNLKEHKLTHLTEKPYRCNICAKTWITPSDLKKHMRTHSGEKPYSCQYCERNFARKETMRVHERTHTGEKPYSCNMCMKKFTHLSSLDRHVNSLLSHCGEGKKIDAVLNI